MTKSYKARPRKFRYAELRLRELAVWYEWGDHRKPANALQDAADAVAADELSLEAAEMLCVVWRPHVGLEASVGNVPTSFEESDRLEGIRTAVRDLRHRLRHARTQAERTRIAAHLRAQVDILKENEAPWTARRTS